jgi:hypothetical protein
MRSKSHKQILPEYLGTIDAQMLLSVVQHLDNTNLRFSPIPEMLQLLQSPIVFDAEVEYTWAEGADPHHERAVSKRFVRIVAAPEIKAEPVALKTVAELAAAE